jgi:hypothetical protein
MGRAVSWQFKLAAIEWRIFLYYHNTEQYICICEWEESYVECKRVFSKLFLLEQKAMGKGVKVSVMKYTTHLIFL